MILSFSLTNLKERLAIHSAGHFNRREVAIFRIKEFHCIKIFMFTVYMGSNLIPHANGGYTNYGLTWLDGHRRQLLVTVMFI
jgi:hypothetical protein